MRDIPSQMVDLLISHSQIFLRSRPYDEGLSQWGTGNIDQGAVLHADYLIFDPLPDDAFGAKVYLQVLDKFEMDERAARCIVAPFHITDRNALEVASATEKFKISLGLPLNSYNVYYEVCEGDEVFYKFTFVSEAEHHQAKYLRDDPWGGKKDMPLVSGKFDRCSPHR
ncbi:competence protein ComJ [Burkholderia pseudomultivorans]|uniref:competence protein ComJ n=1 Tax=Burkholderia pseudomultivorans TaxID=1207504 RepID=UPI002874ADF0|nr:competence protein ComJ [Burkholderia pseudomultivorans]MDS0859609.1 competence protein ComJ [Burkholderia pseudomultivorans]